MPELVTDKVASERQRHRWIDWVFTTDHKRIGLMFMVTAAVFFVLGGVEAMMMRLQLGAANNSLITPQQYNELFTLHGTTMMFLFLTPMIIGLGTYLLPLQIGARSIAFPRLASLSYWLFLLGGIVLYITLFFTPPEAGWTSYPPLSSILYSPSGGQDAWCCLFILTSISALIASVNFIVTLANMRADGLSWDRVPAFSWTILVYALLALVTLPVATGAAVMLLSDRNFGTSFFSPTEGGSALLWQNLFWFFGQPETYLALIPAFGIVTEILGVFSRGSGNGRRTIGRAVAVLALLATVTWGNQLFTSTGDTTLHTLFMITTLLMFVPISVVLIKWLTAIRQGENEFSAAFLFAIGFVGIFVFTVLSGLLLAVFPIAWQLQDSYFAVAQFHYAMVGGAVIGILAAIHFWFPKMTGRLLNEKLAKASFWLIFVGFNATFLVQHSLGLEGMPRRIYEYSVASGWEGENLFATIGSFILAVGLLMVAANILRSLANGPKAGADPWRANTLEWFTPSPPPAHNFDVVPAIDSLEPMSDIRKQVEGSANERA
jgi:cytochrome c oxidase subunit 1